MERRLKVTLNKNGSVEILPEDVPSYSQNWIPGLFLLLGFCFGTGLGLITLLGLRIKSCSKLLIGLQIAAILDCIQGQVLGAVFLILKPNNYVCRLSACTSTTLLIVETVEVMLFVFPLRSIKFLFLPWILGFLVGLLIILDYQIPVNFYPGRYGCFVVNGQHGWLWVVTILILGTSWLGLACGAVHGVMFREKNLDVIVSRLISIFYIIFVFPTALIMLVSMSIKPNVINNSDLVGNIFIWGRYQFNLLIPLVILIFYKNVRKESMDMICFCRKNSIGQLTTHNEIKRISEKQVGEEHSRSDTSTSVLFSTSDSLYLKTLDNTNKSESLFFCEQCDLTLEKTTTKAPGYNPDATSVPKKNVRFASPLSSNIHVDESGVWCNTEDKMHLISIESENENETINQLGVT